MLVGLALLLQAHSSPLPPAQRLSERLFYANPYQQGAISCNHRIAEQQQQEFDRRFGSRIAALMLREIKKRGAGPGFDAVPLGSCSRDNASARFEAALQEFAIVLSTIEREYP